jgi:hypothetical protein
MKEFKRIHQKKVKIDSCDRQKKENRAKESRDKKVSLTFKLLEKKKPVSFGGCAVFESFKKIKKYCKLKGK